MKTKKKFIILSAFILFLVGGIVLADNNDKEIINKKFNCYGFSATKRDIEYWKNPSKTNQYGNLEKNLERRFLQTRVARVDENDNFICVNSFGATFLPSRFKTTLGLGLSSGITPAGNYLITLSSKTTFDGHVLTTGDFGIATSTNTIPIHINPSGSTDEIAICKGISPTTTAMVDCTRGYNFYDSNTSSGNVKAHSSGETVIISNDTHFIANQYVSLYDNQVIQGLKTFATTTGAITKIFFGDNMGSYLWYNTTTDQLGWATSTSEFAFNSGGTQFTVVNPITLLSGELKVATSSYDFILRDNLLAVSTSTISNGTASGKAIDDLFNARYNATTTKEKITINTATTTRLVIGNNQPTGSSSTTAGLYLTSNATSTGSLDVSTLCFAGASCSTGLRDSRTSTSTADATTTITASGQLNIITKTYAAGEIKTGDTYMITYNGVANIADSYIYPTINYNGQYSTDSNNCTITGNAKKFFNIGYLTFGQNGESNFTGSCNKETQTLGLATSTIWSYASTTDNFSTEPKTIIFGCYSNNSGNGCTLNSFSIMKFPY